MDDKTATAMGATQRNVAIVRRETENLRSDDGTNGVNPLTTAPGVRLPIGKTRSDVKSEGQKRISPVCRPPPNPMRRQKRPAGESGATMATGPTTRVARPAADGVRAIGTIKVVGIATATAALGIHEVVAAGAKAAPADAVVPPREHRAEAARLLAF